MQKVRLGFHVFREKATSAQTDTCEKSCIVIAKNDDCTAKILVFDRDGSQFVIDRADLVQLNEGIEPHYEEAMPQAAAAKQTAAQPDEPSDYEQPTPSTVPGEESTPSFVSPEEAADHAGIH